MDIETPIIEKKLRGQSPLINPRVNGVEPRKLKRGKTPEEIKAYNKAYYQKNKDEINKKREGRNKTYYEEHRKELIQKHYYDKFEEIQAKSKLYYQNKKKQKVICDCGAEVVSCYLNKHCLTDKHKLKMEKKKIIEDICGNNI